MIKWLFRVLPIIYMIAIWMMSSHSSDAIVELPNSEWDGYIKESLHLVEFGLLYLFLALAWLTMRELNGGINMILILISCLYGLTDEIHQSFVPYRTATVIDLVKDCSWRSCRFMDSIRCLPGKTLSKDRQTPAEIRKWKK